MFEAFFAEVEEVRRHVPGMERGALCDVSAVLGKIRAISDGLEARVLSALDGLGDDGPGASSTVRSVAKCSQREADRRSARAEVLVDMPGVARALDSGEITCEHVDALVKAAGEVSPGDVERSGLVGLIKSMPADMAGRKAREWANAHRCEDDTQSRHERRRARRKFMIFRGDADMVVVHGEYDPVAGVEIEARVEAETNRLFHLDGGRGVADQVRTVAQRRADALYEIICGQPAAVPGDGGDNGDRAGSGHGGSGRLKMSGPRHQMVIVADAGVITGENPAGRCEVIGGGAIPHSVLERLACNSDLFAMLFSHEGQPLWHGRKVRTATDDQIRALIVRDKSCVICDRAPRWCEAHHVIPWQAPGRGPTDIDNLVLLCSHHHHLVHDQRWNLNHHTNNTWTVTPPDEPP